MAEYRDQYKNIQRAGADVAAVSVDEPVKSERVREKLKLAFPILCDTQKSLITAWSILNENERGGIAVPSVFVIDHDLRVQFASVDRMGARVPASAIAHFLAGGMRPEHEVPRHRVFPRPKDWYRAIRDARR